MRGCVTLQDRVVCTGGLSPLSIGWLPDGCLSLQYVLIPLVESVACAYHFPFSCFQFHFHVTLFLFFFGWFVCLWRHFHFVQFYFCNKPRFCWLIILLMHITFAFHVFTIAFILQKVLNFCCQLSVSFCSLSFCLSVDPFACAGKRMGSTSACAPETIWIPLLLSYPLKYYSLKEWWETLLV